MEFELKNKVSLSPASQAQLEKFIQENHDRKEVTTHDVVALLARAAGLMPVMCLADGKKLDENGQRQLLQHLYDRLVKDEANGFEQDLRLPEIIDTIFKVRAGVFELDLGSKGVGCFPCCRSVKVSLEQ